jgi:hypothetical protein
MEKAFCKRDRSHLVGCIVIRKRHVPLGNPDLTGIMGFAGPSKHHPFYGENLCASVYRDLVAIEIASRPAAGEPFPSTPDRRPSAPLKTGRN